jgi:hypothetical protein
MRYAALCVAVALLAATAPPAAASAAPAAVHSPDPEPALPSRGSAVAAGPGTGGGAVPAPVPIPGDPAALPDPTSGDTTPPAARDALRVPRRADRAAARDVDGQPFTGTTFRIELNADGSAAWTVVVRYRLDDGNRTAAFREVATAFENGETGPDAAVFRNYAAGAAAATGREMRIRDVERSTLINETANATDGAAVGELRLSFVWTEFLRPDGDRLVLDDAFRTPDNGTWLSSLRAGQRLEIRTPEGYAVSGTPGVAVELRENTVVVEGPRTFGADPADRLAIVYSPVGTVATEEPDWPVADASTGVIAGLVVVGEALAAGLLLYRRRDRGAAGGSGDGPTGAAGTSGSDGPGGPGGTAAGEGTGAGAGAGTATGAGEADGDGGGEEGPDLSLLSDEERVERLLERNGGRMRQADIVAETGWSDAKVSQLLSEMADEGEVEKLRLGRENLISLPDGGEGGGGSGAQ